MHCHSAFAFESLFIYFICFVPSFFVFFECDFFFPAVLCVIQHLEYLVAEGRPAMNFTFFQKFVEGAAAGSYEERLSCHAVIVRRLFRLVYLRGSANVINKSCVSLSLSLSQYVVSFVLSTCGVQPISFSLSLTLSLSIIIYLSVYLQGSANFISKAFYVIYGGFSRISSQQVIVYQSHSHSLPLSLFLSLSVTRTHTHTYTNTNTNTHSQHTHTHTHTHTQNSRVMDFLDFSRWYTKIGSKPLGYDNTSFAEIWEEKQHIRDWL